MPGPSGFHNRGIKQYSPAQKAAYYRGLAKSGVSHVGGGYTTAQKAAYFAKLAGAKSYSTKRSTYTRSTYKRPTLKGHGRYITGRITGNAGTEMVRSSTKGAASKIGRAAGSFLGNSIAPGIGGAIGGALGNAAGSLFSKITGWGDYKIHHNTVIYPKQENMVPAFANEDTTRVRKREYVCDIDATTAFANNTFAINPGNHDLFPWLANIACCFQQYHFNGLVFFLKSTSSTAIASSTNLGMGQVIMATNYDSSDGAFTDSPTALGSTFANSAPPFADMYHAIECAPDDQAQVLYYVRSGAVPSGSDIKTYDLGLFQIITEKMQSNYAGMAQLWVSYDVTLCKSIPRGLDGADVLTDHYQLQGWSQQNTLGGASGVFPILRKGSSAGTSIVQTGGYYNTIAFDPEDQTGTYYVYIQWPAASGSYTIPTFTVTGLNNAEGVQTCDILRSWNNNTTYFVSNGGATAIQAFIVFVVQLYTPEAKLQITVSGALPTYSSVLGDIIITQVNGAIYQNDLPDMMLEGKEEIPDEPEFTAEERKIIEDIRNAKKAAQSKEAEKKEIVEEWITFQYL